jgi:hypothetical protein
MKSSVGATQTMKSHDYKLNGCRNCGTHRYEEKSAGYCRRCAYKAAKLRRLMAGTWKQCGRYPRLTEQGRLWKIWETKKELQTIRQLEDPLSQSQIDPKLVVDLLFSIVNSTRAKPKDWTNLGTCFFNYVPPSRNPFPVRHASGNCRDHPP